jgi:flagellar biosynthesis/type III secretory pathway protein FliH
MEEVAMGDPVIEKARQTLQTVSDDPMAREIARLRFNAQVVNRLERAALLAEGEARGRAEGEARGRAEGEARGRAEGEARGRAEGEAQALRGAILGLCSALSVPLDPTREDLLAQVDVTSLQRIFDALVRDRAVLHLSLRRVCA